MIIEVFACQRIPERYEFAAFDNPDDMGQLAVTLVIKLDLAADAAPGSIAQNIGNLGLPFRTLDSFIKEWCFQIFIYVQLIDEMVKRAPTSEMSERIKSLREVGFQFDKIQENLKKAGAGLSTRTDSTVAK